ncbi:MAG: TetR/AcrR family transcriptional regulator [Thermodesulfobacteriota bacterium]|nr:TetR/AcrR family transcriptional regulator [Thermodesulfobacteriota bacterium]
MPKAPMSREEVEIIRGRILDTALDIIIEEGYKNLSVRKIAARLDVTATTIYNYYTGKDELNLMIRVRGFEMLHGMLTRAAARQDTIEQQLIAMIRAYVRFGLTYQGYYDLMFNLDTPKYLDYVGTEMEPTAAYEKKTALKCLHLFSDPIRAYLAGHGPALPLETQPEPKPVPSPEAEQFILNKVVMFWSDLHGLITLCNSRLFHEVLDNVEAFIEARITDLVDNFLKLKARLDAGEPLMQPTSA